jgi:hypothetical protein
LVFWRFWNSNFSPCFSVYPEPGTREQVYEGTCFQLEKINGRGEWVGVNRKTWREVTVPKPPENHIRLAPPKMK